MNINQIADYIQTKLLEQGFIIHRYDAYSTNSIYLKLDYGAMNSIRISDHRGKQHLSYKYNIDCTKIIYNRWKKDEKGFWKYYCGKSIIEIDKLIDMILSDKLHKRTFNNYKQLIQKYKKESINAKGFRQQAREVNLR